MDWVENSSFPQHAVVFGRRLDVQARFIDIHRELGGGTISSVRDRTMTLVNGVAITYIYLEDGDNIRGFHFDSVWIVRGDQAWVRQMVQRHEGVVREGGGSGMGNSGYRFAVREQYGPSVEHVSAAVHMADARQQMLRQRFEDGADRSMVPVNTAPSNARQHLTEREQALQRELNYLTRRLEERSVVDVRTSVDRPSVTISIQPMDVNGQPVGEPILREVDVVDGEASSFTVDVSNIVEADLSEPIRFPEKRIFLKEDGE